MDTPSQWFSPWLFLQITVAHTCFNLYIFRNGFIGYSQCFFSENLHRFSHDGLLGSGRYTSSMGTVPWCRMGCFVRVVSMPLPISCWMRCGLVCVCVGWGWSQNSQGTHGRLATCFGPYPKTFIYLYYLYLVSRMVFRFFGNFFPNTYLHSSE